MELKKYFNQENLHHAYLIEGNSMSIVPELEKIFLSLNISIKNNPDFYSLEMDTFKMEDARNLKSLTSEKGFGVQSGSKKIFIISAKSFLPEAQNSLLKLFEEPIPETHFFVVAPSTQIFIPTLLSRFYVIKTSSNLKIDTKEAEDFLKMPLLKRIDFLKELLAKDEESKEDEEVIKDSHRARALHLLDSLEYVLHEKFATSKSKIPHPYFEQIFTVRKYLRQPGSSAKTLMESLALGIPEKVL